MKKIYLKSLHNAEHLAFMSNVVTLLGTVDNDFLKALHTQLSENVAQEELAQKEIKKSEHTATLSELDAIRDRLYRGLVFRVESESYSRQDGNRQAAERKLN